MSRAATRPTSPTWNCAAFRKRNLTAILKLRSAYEKELRTILREGADSGAFAIDDAGAHRHGYHSDDYRRYRLVPARRAAVGRRMSRETYLAMTMRLVGPQGG